MNLVDIAANFSDDDFCEDALQVIERALENGIDQIVCVGAHIASSEDGIALSRRYPTRLFATVGLHPHVCERCDADILAELRALAADPTVVAIGEAGLDFYRQLTTPAIQERGFEEMMGIAAAIGKPLFVHVRDAHERCAEMLSAQRDSLGKIIVHCFTGDQAQLHRYLDLDAYIGITGWICDERRGKHLHALVSEVPPSRLLLETDSPYLLPRTMTRIQRRALLPISGRNEPCTLPWVLETVARCCARDPETVARQTATAARECFALPEPGPRVPRPAGPPDQWDDGAMDDDD